MYFTVFQMSNYYKAAIRPILEYASVVFDNCSKVDSERLEYVQRRAANVCTGAMKLTESVKVLSDLGWERLSSRRLRAKLILFYKIKNGLTAVDYLSNLIPENVEVDRKYNLRSTIPHLKLPCGRIKIYDSSFFPSCIFLWNKLTPDVVDSRNVGIFRNHLLKSNLQNSVLVKQGNFLFVSNGYIGRIITQMRYGLSPLKNHLFTYNITDNPMCPSCLEHVESTVHFFFDCIHYNVARVQLINSIIKIMRDLLNITVNENDRDFLLECMLFGSNCNRGNLKLVNELIYKSVVGYCLATMRFSSRSN